MLAELAAATGVRLTDEGRPPGGQIGACYVRWPDGHHSVLTYVPAEHREWAHQGAELARIARAGDDLVHVDLHPGNVLIDQAGTVTGLVDWDGAARRSGLAAGRT